MRTTATHVFFWGDTDIYSNFYPAPFTDGERSFTCSEQRFMWSKTMHFGDVATAQKILLPAPPYAYKKLGRSIIDYDDDAWSQVRVKAMEEACLLKFTANPKLGEELLATGSLVLVEASPYDKIWGIGLAENDPKIEDPRQWKGSNLLGEVLMSVRNKLALASRPTARPIMP